GDERNPMLQRVYGTAFATPKELDQHLARIEEARRREVRHGTNSPEAQAAFAAARASEKAMVQSLGDAERDLASAMRHVRGHAEARLIKAELHWSEFELAEDAGDERAAALHRQVVSQFNDGDFDVRLRGEGTLAVTTVAFPCTCLHAGRRVSSPEAVRNGYHLASGRALDAIAPIAGLPALEWAGEVLLRAHGPSCVAQPAPGADVWLYRYATEGVFLKPALPDLGQGTRRQPLPPAILDQVYPHDSPFRPAVDGIHLGRTPIARLAVPSGSYLLVIAKDGAIPVRVPVRVPRCDTADIRVTLYSPGEIPHGFTQVPSMKFSWQGDRENPHSLPHEIVTTPEFFMGIQPVTCAEYAEFLSSLEAVEPAAAAARAPRGSPQGAPLWAGPPWTPPPTPLPEGGGGWKRLPGVPANWEADWPVLGISWEDALEYCAWLRSAKGWLFTLPHELDWALAARGPDRRRYPWGNGWDPACCNSDKSGSGPPSPVSVRAFPADESPFGVRGAGGNSRDFCLNSPGADFPSARLMRGGTWAGSGIQNSVTWRSTADERHVSPKGGMRVMLVPRLG
ncbi:MAG: SUMF1/EgtB/PvdO family nonheme iron enzyme, partial [Candidatus Brocadiae bacterium]|nr:SUMF1/EgtB/PvdO family nonheme iron enzyme [Candidatus Brocadiia bacterium]